MCCPHELNLGPIQQSSGSSRLISVKFIWQLLGNVHEENNPYAHLNTLFLNMKTLQHVHYSIPNTCSPSTWHEAVCYLVLWDQSLGFSRPPSPGSHAGRQSLWLSLDSALRASVSQTLDSAGMHTRRVEQFPKLTTRTISNSCSEGEENFSPRSPPSI